MATETAEDRAAFLDTEELAHAVTVTPSGGGAPRTFAGIFEPEGVPLELSDGLRATSTRPTLFGLAVDLETLGAGDTVAVQGFAEVYTVGDPAIPDGSGFASIVLSRAW